eukprot:TRINITY_DN5875_c0_g1_i1.p1 TRINITY_DN5875_c0_g1~~TRINITY_DN5875_c0_g1_i1.p1  ORF type:complete len:601 (-),score=145.36 TRINITY_DN5875_c0_g1_i1:1619-3421(-)
MSRRSLSDSSRGGEFEDVVFSSDGEEDAFDRSRRVEKDARGTDTVSGTGGGDQTYFSREGHYDTRTALSETLDLGPGEIVGSDDDAREEANPDDREMLLEEGEEGEDGDFGGDGKGEGGKDKSELRDNVWVYLSAFFITIATILGTGILALPVKVAHCGFEPFLATFVVCLVMQSFIVVYMLELLQRTEAIFQSSSPSSRTSTSGEESNERTRIISSRPELKIFVNKKPNLHSMGKLFLGAGNRIAFDSCVLLHFISILISYTLAGSQAYGQLLGIAFAIMILPFFFVYVSFVLGGQKIIRSTITLLTFGKGSLLVGVVVVVGMVGMEVNHHAKVNWKRTAEPFLMGTVALGGVMNILPVVYARVPHTKSAMKKFRNSILLGVFACFILNIAWTYFVLQIVPQSSSDPDEPTLKKAEKDGDMATVPVVDVIKRDHPQYTWVAILVEIFIMLSITVSFMTMGTALKHVLDGYSTTIKDKFRSSIERCQIRLPKLLQFLSSPRTALYFVSFGVILLVAILNPHSFLIVLELFTSLALNLESGVFVSYMLHLSQKIDCGSKITLPLPKFSFKFSFVVMGYFWLAIGYDLFLIVGLFAGWHGID